MTEHSVFTIVTDVRREADDRLATLLAKTTREVFQSVDIVHFAAFVIYRPKDLGLGEFGRSKLVFELNVDGPPGDCVDRLLHDLGWLVDSIYACCERYPAGGSDAEKKRYLESAVRKPQLSHVGAPNRSVKSIKADTSMRSDLESRLQAAHRASLPQKVARPATAVREYWTWEILKPWVAWLIAVGATLAVAWVGLRTSWSQSWWLVGLLKALGYLAVLAVAVLRARRWWTTALPELRDRVRPWVRWAIVGIVWSVPIRMLWSRSRSGAIGLLALFLVCAGFCAYAAIRRQTDARLRTIRTDDEPSVNTVWNTLLSMRVCQQSSPWWYFLRRAWSWRGVILPLAIAILLPWYLRPRPLTVVLILTFLYCAKAVWLSVLVGWPDRDGSKLWALKIVAFMIFVPVGGFCLVAFLTWGAGWPSYLVSPLVLLTLFALWAVPLPSPEVPDRRPDPAVLAKVIDQEDRDIQNHMAAIVPLKQDYWFRAFVLRSFLFILNGVFFRSFLPDWYKGKLFGIPTVHFCQWVLLDDRNFLFHSNYDSSWTSYLDDFGSELKTGLQKIWGQAEGNPGMTDLVRFKGFARMKMVPHAFWYSAYPGLTVRQIWNNERIRQELSPEAGEESIVGVLRRFAAAPRTVPDVLHARIN